MTSTSADFEAILASTILLGFMILNFLVPENLNMPQVHSKCNCKERERQQRTGMRRASFALGERKISSVRKHSAPSGYAVRERPVVGEMVQVTSPSRTISRSGEKGRRPSLSGRNIDKNQQKASAEKRTLLEGSMEFIV
jgi:hypothetical protein